MMRLLFLVFLWALPAWGQVTVTQMVVPTYGGTDVEAPSGVANQLRCYRWPAPQSITSVMHLMTGITTGVGGATCGIALYPDDNIGTALASGSASCASAGTLVVTSSAWSLTAGTMYRWCACSTSTSSRLLSIFDFATAGMGLPYELNAGGSIVTATAATGCTSGVPPSATGALTGVAFEPFLMVVE